MENEVKEVAVEEHSSHHHHSHHHHHHHKSSRKKKFSLKRFLKKHKTPVRVATLFLVLALTIAATAFTIKQLDQPSQGGKPTTNQPSAAPQIPEGQVAVTVTRFDAPVALHHDIVTTYLNANISVSAREILKDYMQTDIRLDHGQPVVISYDVLGLADGCNVTGFRVEVTEKGQKDPCFRKDCTAGESSVMIYNLKSATSYQYVVRADFTTMKSITVSGTFETAAGPRLLKVDGIANVRDFGGWKVGNTTIKQGLLYRGSELDGMDQPDFNITSTGRQVMLHDFGIRMEMDLREPAVRSDEDRLGATVICPTPYAAPFFEAAFAEGRPAMARVFKDLANPENYPIYLHCSLGRDRTGTVCMILGALLGMEEEDILREYGLSALYYGGTDYEYAYKVFDGLKTYGGDTMSEQAENYLLHIGLTEAEILSLRQIYLG